MPFLLGLLAVLGAIYFFVIRTRNTADMAGEVLDAANDVRLAARRFGFKRRTNVHPVESIDDSRVVIAGIASTIFEMDGAATAEQRGAVVVYLQSVCDIDKAEAEELVTLGRWLSEQCGTHSAGIARLSRRLFKLSSSNGFDPLVAIVSGAAKHTGVELSERQTDALAEIRRTLKL